MQTDIFVTIHSFNAVNQGSDMVIDVITNATGIKTLVLQPYDSEGNTSSQKWQLIPNLVLNCYSPGFTLYNTEFNQCAYNPENQGDQGDQVILNDDPTPWGANDYCWTMFGLGTTPNEEKVTIQDYKRNLCMNCSGASIDAGTQIIMWPWDSGDNALWILRTTSAPTS